MNGMAGLLRRFFPLRHVHRLGKAVYWRLPASWRDTVVGFCYRHAGALFRGIGHYEMWRGRGQDTGSPNVTDRRLTDLSTVDPLESVAGRVAIHAHIFYPDLAGEFASHFHKIPYEFHLFVSVPDESAASICRKAFQNLPLLQDLQIEVTPNRGRDIAPMLCTFGERLAQFDYIAHVHSKKSLYNRGATDGWREYLLDSLFGSEERIRRIFGLMQQGTGMVFPQSFFSVPYSAMTWLANRPVGMAWCHRLGIDRPPRGYFDFPVGSMFWARTEVLRPLFDSSISLEEFEEEAGQTDGTLAHAMERLLGVVARASGSPLGILRDEIHPSWSAWRFDQMLRHRHEGLIAVVSAPDTDVVVFDIFDTLLQRPLLDPEQTKQIVARRVQGKLAGKYLRGRNEAEQAARARAGRDIDLPAIMDEMVRRADLTRDEADVLLALEQEVELAAVSARDDYVSLFESALLAGKRVVLASDMYLPRSHLERMLEHCGIAGWHMLYASSEVGLRKDSGALYDHILDKEGKPPEKVLVIGDNEHSDLQIPWDRGMRTLHVLRPVELARGLPRLSALVEEVEEESAPDAHLALGLIIQKELSKSCFENFDPGCLVGNGSARTIGHAVVGPLVLAFAQWLIDTAGRNGVQRLFFLAREGQFFLEVYRRCAALHASACPATYLVVSRRAVNVPAIRTFQDVLEIARTAFGPGDLEDYVLERFGLELDGADIQDLHDRGLWKKSCQVMIRDGRMDDLLPALEALFPRILQQSAMERDPLLAYLSSVGMTADGSSAVVDIGYSGTIQRRLNVLLGGGIHGYYMASSVQAAELAAEYAVTVSGCFHEQAKLGAEGPPFIAQSFIAEKLFSSDDAQVIRYFLDETGSPAARYRSLSPVEITARTVRSEIQAGALEYVDAALRMNATLLPDFQVPAWLARRLFELFIECPGQGEQSVIGELVLDDYYCGRGLVV